MVDERIVHQVGSADDHTSDSDRLVQRGVGQQDRTSASARRCAATHLQTGGDGHRACATHDPKQQGRADPHPAQTVDLDARGAGRQQAARDVVGPARVPGQPEVPVRQHVADRRGHPDEDDCRHDDLDDRHPQGHPIQLPRGRMQRADAARVDRPLGDEPPAETGDGQCCEDPGQGERGEPEPLRVEPRDLHLVLGRLGPPRPGVRSLTGRVRCSACRPGRRRRPVRCDAGRRRQRTRAGGRRTRRGSGPMEQLAA